MLPWQPTPTICAKLDLLTLSSDFTLYLCFFYSRVFLSFFTWVYFPFFDVCVDVSHSENHVFLLRFTVKFHGLLWGASFCKLALTCKNHGPFMSPFMSSASPTGKLIGVRQAVNRKLLVGPITGLPRKRDFNSANLI